jgi:hypothetical protein
MYRMFYIRNERSVGCTVDANLLKDRQILCRNQVYNFIGVRSCQEFYIWFILSQVNCRREDWKTNGRSCSEHFRVDVVILTFF